MPNKRKIVIITIVVLLLVGAGVFAYRNYRQVLEERGTSLAPLAQKPAYQKAEELHHRGDPASIPLYEQLIAEEQDPNLRAYLNASLASDYYRTGGDAGQRKAIEIVKSVIADRTVSDGVRAGMINRLLALGFTVRDLDFVEQVTLAGEPYQTIFNEENRQVSATQRRLYEWSVDLFPTANAHLQLAHWYGLRVLRQDYSLVPPGERAADIEVLKFHLSRGEALIERDQQYNSASLQAGLYILAAANHGILALVREGDFARAEQLFEYILQRIDEIGASEVHLQSVGFEGRTQYAVLLLDIFGAARRDDACRVMRPIARLQPREATLYPYILWVDSLIKNANVEHPVGYSEPYPTHTDLLRVARTCPDVAAFVERLAGMSLDQLLEQGSRH